MAKLQNFRRGTATQGKVCLGDLGCAWSGVRRIVYGHLVCPKTQDVIVVAFFLRREVKRNEQEAQRVYYAHRTP